MDARDPGALSAVFDEYWPAYRKWFTRDDHPHSSLAESEAALREHMPELVPVWQSLVRELGKGDEIAARFLTEWNPPPLTSNCSQAVLGDGRLVRNYDYDPALFDAVVLRSAWLRPVIGTADQAWGLLDGMNDAGLIASFTFGGRPEVGVGFGVPLVVRYILETCTTTREAVSILRRVPIHVAYNVTVTDESGESATVFVGPNRDAKVTSHRVTTNHQGRVDWPEHAERFLSVERLDTLDRAVRHGEDVVDVMLRPPMRADRFADGFVTLYTAAYDNDTLEVTYHWPQAQWTQSLHGDLDGRLDVDLGASPMLL
ncbi:MAG TPA: C45 family peptidase [Actinomycetes bacterium]|nr:C45 family peptidase [Actinomycetes bacterium]